MNTPLFLLAVLALRPARFALGRRRVLREVGDASLHSLPGYYGAYAALWTGLPGLAVLVVWAVGSSWAIDGLTLASLPTGAAGETAQEIALFLNDVKNESAGLISQGEGRERIAAAADRYDSLRSSGIAAAVALAGLLSLAGGALALRRIRPDLAARVLVERSFQTALMMSAAAAILVTAGIVLSLIFETARFFAAVSPIEFLFGLHWSPQTALRADQVGSSGSFGAVPIFTGTLLITGIAMLVAVPIGLLSAIYMTFYATPRFRDVAKPILEILAGVPTVVYGFFAALTVAPWIRDVGTTSGSTVASESALAAGLVMGIMIIPFVSSLSDDAITAVPMALRDGSFGLGATRSETIRHVILPAALPGIVGGFLLAVSRAIGETMIVVMAAGLAANLTANPLEAVTTVTVQIVTLLTGDQEFDSAKTLAAFALGLVLFVVTLASTSSRCESCSVIGNAMSETSPGDRWAAPAMQARLRRRHRAERRFQLVGARRDRPGDAQSGSLLVTIGVRGFGAFRTSEISPRSWRSPAEARASPGERDYARPGAAGAARPLPGGLGPARAARAREPDQPGAGSVVRAGARGSLADRAGAASIWLPRTTRSTSIGRADARDVRGRRVSEQQLAWIGRLEEQGRVRTAFSTGFLTRVTPGSPSWPGSGARWWAPS